MTLTILLLAAHFFRAGQYGLVLASAGMLYFNSAKAGWKNYAAAFFLLWGVWVWGSSAYSLIVIRMQLGLPWFRGSLILAVVAALTALGGYYAYKRAGSMAGDGDKTPLFKAAVFIASILLLFFISGQSPYKLLLLERYFPLWGSGQIFFAAWYAAYVAGRLIDPETSRLARKKAWLIFSCIFYGQLVLGLAGFSEMLMSGKLHIPIPAFIVFGPAYRGDVSLFMPLLLLFSVLIAGTSWCSFLCYFGSLDSAASACRAKQSRLPEYISIAHKFGRPAVLLLGIGLAVFLRISQAPFEIVATAVIAFICAIFLLIFMLSKKYGSMFHCVSICPVGLIVNLLGRLSPWRIRVDKRLCTDCGACEKVCDYWAISRSSRRRGISGFHCSACRDCLGRCSAGAIYVWNPFIPRRFSEQALVAVVTVLHILFLCVARV